VEDAKVIPNIFNFCSQTKVLLKSLENSEIRESLFDSADVSYAKNVYINSFLD